MSHYNPPRNERGQFLKGYGSLRIGKTMEEIFGSRIAKNAKKKMRIAKEGKTWDEIWGKEGAEKRRAIQMPRGSDHPNWKGGKVILQGYSFSRHVDHPFVHKNGYVADHRLIAESALGRPLKSSEVVHHINGDKTDNRNSNLLICTVKYHNFLNARMALLYQREHFGQHTDPPSNRLPGAVKVGQIGDL